MDKLKSKTLHWGIPDNISQWMKWHFICQKFSNYLSVNKLFFYRFDKLEQNLLNNPFHIIMFQKNQLTSVCFEHSVAIIIVMIIQNLTITLYLNTWSKKKKILKKIKKQPLIFSSLLLLCVFMSFHR